MFCSCKKQNGDKQIISFEFTTPAAIGVIDENAKTITVGVPLMTDVTALVPVIKVSDKATVSPASGVTQNFTYPVTYTVTAEDGSVANYIVTVTKGGGGGGEVELIKSATIHYHKDDAEIYFCFDDYGERFRIEGFDDDGHTIAICNNGNEFGWNNKDIIWVSAPTTCLLKYDFMAQDQIFGYEALVTIGLATKTTEIIAGQPCVVYRVETTEFGVWRKTVYLKIRNLENGRGYEAVSARLGCPANAFTQTVEIDW